jgi:hypothetical protein
VLMIPVPPTNSARISFLLPRRRDHSSEPQPA